MNWDFTTVEPSDKQYGALNNLITNKQSFITSISNIGTKLRNPTHLI